MKAKIYFLLLAMPLLSVPDLQGKSVKTYKEPQCLYSECPQAAVTRVEFADTATVVSFRLSGHPYEQFVLPERIYACGDDGGRYSIRRMEGTDDGRRLWLSGDGTAEFSLVFESLPADTKCLDVVNIGNNAVFRFFGIHDRRHAPKIKEREEAVDRSEVAEDVRRRGTAVIRGRIADYSPEWRLDFIKCYHRPLFSGGTPLMVETALAGSAEPGGSPLTGSYAVPQGAGGDILRSIIGEDGKYTELVCISSPEAGRRLLGDRMTNLLTDFRDSGDIRFVFVFDGGAFTQEEYEGFTRNNLDGGACHRVSRDDFTDMREALHFTGGTVVRTLDRDGQVMRTPLSLDNETYFRSSLRRLLQAKQP